MSQDKQPDNHDETEDSKDSKDEKPEAGFDVNFKIPFFSAHFWGGREQLHLIWPWLRWICIGAAAIYGIKEIIGAFK